MTVLSLRPVLAAALLGLNLGAIAAPAAPTAVSFDTAPRAGQHQRQQIDIQATMKMRTEATPDATDEQRGKIAQASEQMAKMGPVKMAMQMQQTLKVDQPDADGWLPMTVSTGTKNAQMEVGGKIVSLLQPKATDLAFAARFNPRDFAFELQKVDGAPELNEALRAQGTTAVSEALQLFKALSQRPLKVGESVDVPLTMALPVPLPGGAGAMQGQLRYTLARVDRGVAYFDLGMDLKLDINAAVPVPAAAASAASAPQGEAASAAEAAAVAAAASAPAAGAAPKSIHVVVNGSGKGSSALRLADRLPLSNQLAMDMQMSVNTPDNALMLIDMNMVMQSKGESLAKPAAAKAQVQAPAKKKS